MKHLAPLLLPLALAGRGGFDHGLEMEPLAVPEAHHGEKMRLSRFLVAVPGIEETATRLLNKCVSGQDVAHPLGRRDCLHRAASLPATPVCARTTNIGLSAQSNPFPWRSALSWQLVKPACRNMLISSCGE